MRRHAALSVLTTGFLAALFLAAPLRADDRKTRPMVDPEIDAGPGPFCYFSRPTDQLGVMDGEHGFQVTAEGWLYTRRIEVVFMAGPDRAPVQQRIRTLRDGCLPIVEYHIDRAGIRYRWTMFADATVPGMQWFPESLRGFVRIEAENLGSESAEACFAAGLRHRGPSNGPRRMRADLAYPFRWRSRYEVRKDLISRDGRAVMLYASSRRPESGATLEAPYPGRAFRGSEFGVVEETVVCPLTWRAQLAPGQRLRADLAVPLEPEDLDGKFYLGFAADAFRRRLDDVADKWRRLYARASVLVLPEQKAHDTFWTSFANVAIARDRVDENTWIQRVNELQYHTGFWPRDASYFMQAWWYVGLPGEARRVVDHYFRIQNEDGSFRHDPENISPYAIARWYQMTGDQAYAEKAFPYLWKNFQWLKRSRAADPLGLMPKRGRYDNEGIDGHYTGHNFYNLCALREAAMMARDLGKVDEAKAIEAEHAAYRRNFLERLTPLVEKHGQIPPGMDTGAEGANWGNLTGSYPTEVLAPDHPWIAKTSDKLRRELYREGLLIFNAFDWWSLHHYSTIKNTYSDLLRGRDDLVVKDYYALLVHTSASNAGFEFCIVPWAARDFGGNYSPHGWFAAKFIGLTRLMLVREEGDTLHLLSALPPAWVKPGKRVEAKNVLTRFGRVDLLVEGTEAGCKISVKLPAKKTAGPDGLPARVVVHVPWYAELTAATTDSETVKATGHTVTVPPTVRDIELSFNRDEKSYIDYDQAVAAWKAEYARRWAMWRNEKPDAEPFDPFPEKRFPLRAETAARAKRFAAREGLAVDRPVRASSAATGHRASYAADGVGGTKTPYWMPAGGDGTPWWEVDLGGTHTLRQVTVQAAWGVGPLRFSAGARLDRREWTVLADLENNVFDAPDGVYHLFLPAVKARKVRLFFPRGFVPRITEVKVMTEAPRWQQARNPARAAPGNLAHGAHTISSAWEGDNGPWKAVDGRTGWREGYWAGAVGHPQWWLVDLGRLRKVARVRIFFYAGDQRGYAYAVLTSGDGIAWRTIAHRPDPVAATPEGEAVTVTPHPARYVKVIVLKNTANPAAHVAEVQVFGE